MKKSRLTITLIVMGSYNGINIYGNLFDDVLRSHQAQPRYCGEPNGIGFIGGKTHTDIATIDDLYLNGWFRPYFLLTRSLFASHSSRYHGRGRHHGAQGHQEEER